MAKRAKKYEYWEHLWELLEENPQILIVHADNVGSKLLQNIRLKLRGKAEVLFGKNTLIRKGIHLRLTEPTANEENYDQRKDNWYAMDQIKELEPLIRGNVGMVFCNGNMNEVLEIIEGETTPAEAKAGSLAPVDVVVPAGPTGMDPSITSFFQSLGISTKIVRGQVDIMSDIKVVEEGTRVGRSEAELLKKLNIRPFTYGLRTINVYDNGSVYAAEVLKLSEEDVLNKFSNGVRAFAAISLGAGMPNEASAPHSIISSFKSLVSMALEAEYSFKEGDRLMAMARDPSAFVVAAAPDTAGQGASEAAPAEEEEEEEDADIDLGGGLFGGDDDEW